MPRLFLSREPKAPAPAPSAARPAEDTVTLAMAEEWFEAQYRRLRRKAVRMAYGYVQDEAEELADEVLADLWIACYSNGTLDDTKVDGLFARILRCRLADHLRHKQRMEIAEPAHVVDIVPRLRLQQEAHLATDERALKESIARAVDRMPEACSRVYRLASERDWEMASVAEELGITVNTARWHLTRAKELLRESLAGQGYDVPGALPRGRLRGGTNR
ncbi:MAG: sigma-70 family RNA polymerase sigma factor [Gemmatimonadaceae bacterium]